MAPEYCTIDKLTCTIHVMALCPGMLHVIVMCRPGGHGVVPRWVGMCIWGFSCRARAEWTSGLSGCRLQLSWFQDQEWNVIPDSSAEPGPSLLMGIHGAPLLGVLLCMSVVAPWLVLVWLSLSRLLPHSNLVCACSFSRSPLVSEIMDQGDMGEEAEPTEEETTKAPDLVEFTARMGNLVEQMKVPLHEANPSVCTPRWLPHTFCCLL